MQRALFAVHTSTAFVDPFRIARLLEKEGIEPVFIFAYEHWTADSFAAQCREAGVAVYRLQPLEGLWNRLLDRLMWIAHGVNRRRGWWPAHFVAEFLDLRKSLVRVNRAFDDLSPDLLVMSIDLAGYDTGVYVRVAHRRGIKAMLVSSMMSIGLDQAEVYYHNPDYHVYGLARSLIARVFPHWVFVHRDRPLLRCPPGRVLAMELLRIAPPMPWIFNSSWADIFYQESDAMLEYYAAGGIPREQMTVTGSTSDDVMAEALAHMEERRAELCRSLDLPPGRKLIVTALPPDFLDQPGGRPECDFTQYDALTDFWLKTCCAYGCNVVVALHPSTPPADVPKYERYGARVALRNTAELVPLCDIFVASISSTIRWAIACGKPVLNYDVYRYRYTDYVGIEGVITIEEQHEYVETLRRLVQDETYADDIRRKQQAIAGRWGRLDGQTGRRLVALAKTLLAGRA